MPPVRIRKQNQGSWSTFPYTPLGYAQDTGVYESPARSTAGPSVATGGQDFGWTLFLNSSLKERPVCFLHGDISYPPAPDVSHRPSVW